MQQSAGSGSPVTLEVVYPESSSRGLALCALLGIKALILLPVIIIMYIFQIGVMFSALIGLFAVIFTGRYPRGLFDFYVRVARWMMQMNVYYLSLSDKYPPFTPE